MHWRFAVWSSLTLLHPLFSRTLKLYQIMSQFYRCWPPYCSYLYLSPEQGHKSVTEHFKRGSRASVNAKTSFSQHSISTWNLFTVLTCEFLPHFSGHLLCLRVTRKQSLPHGPAVPAPCAHARSLLPPRAVTTTRSDTAPGHGGAILLLTEAARAGTEQLVYPPIQI